MITDKLSTILHHKSKNRNSLTKSVPLLSIMLPVLLYVDRNSEVNGWIGVAVEDWSDSDGGRL